MLKRVDEAWGVLPFLASPHSRAPPPAMTSFSSSLGSQIERFLLSPEGRGSAAGKHHLACDLVGYGLPHIAGTVVYTPAGDAQATPPPLLNDQGLGDLEEGCRASCVGAKRHPSGPQCIIEKIEPILAPKYLAVKDIAWRTDDLDRDSVPYVLNVSHPATIAICRGQKLFSWKFRAIGKRHQGRIICEILLFLP